MDEPEQVWIGERESSSPINNVETNDLWSSSVRLFVRGAGLLIGG